MGSELTGKTIRVDRMLPNAPPPYLVTVTAYGPESKELQVRLSCRVVVKLVTLPRR